LVRNNLIAFNTAPDSFGGGFYSNYDRAILSGNTIVFNHAASGGGILALNFPDAVPIVSNSIVWGNTASDGTDNIGLYTQTGSGINITYSNIEGGWPGVGNIDEEPMFVRIADDGRDGWGDDPDTPDIDEGVNDDLGDFRLLLDSLCIDAGNPFYASPDPDERDLAGVPRVLCEVIDMGAHEAGMGDYDCDRTIDLYDYSILAWSCITGPRDEIPDPPYAEECTIFDFNQDGQIDLTDTAEFFRRFTE
jgi:hypothetical protein